MNETLMRSWCLLDRRGVIAIAFGVLQRMGFRGPGAGRER